MMNEIYEGSTCSDIDCVKLYFKDIKEYDLLPYSETIDLIKKAKAGDENARNKLVEHNLKLAVTIAKKHLGKGVAFLDLIEYGNLAIIKAIKNYDLNSSTKFNVYLSVCIDMYIRKMIAREEKVVSYGTATYVSVGKIKKFCDKFLMEKERETTDEEIKKAVHVKQEIVDLYRATLDKQLVISYDCAPKDGNDQDDDRSIIDCFGTFDKNYDYVLNKIANEQIANGINSINLNDAEKDILLRRYGLKDGRFQTLRSVGREYSKSAERIRQLESGALRKVKKADIFKW